MHSAADELKQLKEEAAQVRYGEVEARPRPGGGDKSAAVKYGHGEDDDSANI